MLDACSNRHEKSRLRYVNFIHVFNTMLDACSNRHEKSRLRYVNFIHV